MAKKLTLETINFGTMMEIFESEMKKILENVADENTPAKKARTLDIKFTFQPNDEREHLVTTVSTKLGLAQPKSKSSVVMLNYTGTSIDAYVSDARQPELGENGTPTNSTPLVPGKAVNS